MFSIVIQNSFKPHFFTEHLTDCFAYGTIPIYLGDPEINKFFNTDGMLKYQGGFNIKSLTKDLYHSRIDSINENLEIIKKMHLTSSKVLNTWSQDVLVEWRKVFKLSMKVLSNEEKK